MVADGGLRALTHRAVDAEAGLPEGSCSTSFRTRLALLTALTEHVGHQLTVEVLALAARLRQGSGAEGAGGIGDLSEERRGFVVAEVQGLFERLLDRPGLVIVQAELSLESRRQPELEAVLGPWRSGMTAIVEAIVRDAGKPDPAQRALTLVAAMEGVVLAGLQEPTAKRHDYLGTAVTMLLGGLY